MEYTQKDLEDAPEDFSECDCCNAVKPKTELFITWDDEFLCRDCHPAYEIRSGQYDTISKATRCSISRLPKEQILAAIPTALKALEEYETRLAKGVQ